MARMPGAEWVGEQSPRTPMDRYDVVCVHTIVGRAPAHAAHFSVKADGTILQSRDTKYRSAANLDGNLRVIAIENEDMGGPFPTWGGSNVPKLTAAQVDANARILAWAHKTHGVPLQLCPNSKPSSRGLGYHRQGIDGNFGPFKFPGRVHGGEVWTEHFGKVCPGDNRIAQLPAILKRAKEIAAPPKAKARLRVATFNVWVGQRGWRLRRRLRKMARAAGWPHVIALQEARGLKRAPRGYRKVVADSKRAEANFNVLLLRKDVELVRERPLSIKGDPWVGPKKQAKTHPPRVHMGATVKAEGLLWDVLGVHRVTSSNGKNREQRRVEAEQIEAWVKTRKAARPGRVVVPLGDWNGVPRDLARATGGVLAMDHIDGAVVVGARVRRVRKLDRKFGSDNHHPVVIDIEEN